MIRDIIRASGLILAAVIVGTASIGWAGGPPTIPAHWVSTTKKLEPVVGDFTFQDVYFTDAGDGWIVGSRFILHILGRKLRLTFTGDRGRLSTIRLPARESGWAAGFRSAKSSSDAQGVLWRYAAGDWSIVDLPQVPLQNWVIPFVRFSSPDSGWASALVEDRELNRLHSYLLRYDGAVWRLNSAVHLADSRRGINDMCFRSRDEGWAAGMAYEPKSDTTRPVLFRVHAEHLEEVRVPGLGGATGRLRSVLCLPDDGAVAIGSTGDGDEQVEALVLMEERGTWKLAPLPERLRHHELFQVAGVSMRDLWFAAAPAMGSPVFLRFDGNRWTETPGPVLPGGRTDGYTVTGMQFTSADEGWAVGNDYQGPGLVRGLIFHYEDGVWRNRNWNWHFWDQRWFGLFGD